MRRGPYERRMGCPRGRRRAERGQVDASSIHLGSDADRSEGLFWTQLGSEEGTKHTRHQCFLNFSTLVVSSRPSPSSASHSLCASRTLGIIEYLELQSHLFTPPWWSQLPAFHVMTHTYACFRPCQNSSSRPLISLEHRLYTKR